MHVTLITPYGGIIGFASFVWDETFYMSGIAIHEKRDGSGYRITYPTRKSNGQTFNIFHPLNRQTSKAIEAAIFQKLKDVINQGCNHAGHNRH